jgi:hypothetical protein
MTLHGWKMRSYGPAGSVHALGYDIDKDAWARLGGRNEKGIIDSSKISW